MDPIPTELTARTPTGPTEPTPTVRTGPTALSAEAFPALATLIGSEAVPRFLARSLGADAYRTRIAPAAAAALFGWPQLNAALAEHRLTPPRLRLERGGADATKGLFRERRTRRGLALLDLDAGVLNARLREGATLILDAANELSPPLQRLCAGLAAEFGSSCQANLYACWGTTQGFDVHWDDHDVFVLQVAGRKRWALYGSTRQAPTRKDHHGEHARPDTPLDEIVLEPGDVLYLPRGYWHAAVGLGEPTLHLTVGLTRKTGADFVHWLADHLLADAAFRTDLPLEQDDAVLGAHLSGLLSRLAAAEPEALGRLYRRHVQASQAHRPALSFPFIGDTAPIPPEMSLSLAEGAVALRREADAVVLSWRGIDFRLALELEPALRILLARGTLSRAVFEAAVPDGVRPLVAAFIADMVGRGVFVLSSGEAP